MRFDMKKIETWLEDKLQRQDTRWGYVTAKDFREVNAWIHGAIIRLVTPYGGEGIEANEMHGPLRRLDDAPKGWELLGPDKRSSQFWRAVRRLCEKKMIEEYHSNAPGHEKSRIRLRLANVLDRLVHSLKDDE